MSEHKYAQLAKEIIETHEGNKFFYCLEEDTFYYYEKGLWKKIYDVMLLNNIWRINEEIKKFPLSIQRQVVDNIKVLKHKSIKDLNSYPIINFINCVLYTDILCTEEHNPIFYSTIQVPYNYEEEEKCPLWVESLNQIFENNKDKIDTLQEFFGYCLTGDVKHKKALLLIGESDSGKSTILNVLRAMLGADACSSVPLKHISNPQYLPRLFNKTCNIDPDVSRDADKYEAEFKTITSGEPVMCSEKYIATFEFIPRCKIVLAANIFPKITDHSSAFYTRLILIPCERIFTEGEKDRDLINKLYKELPGILNWSLEGLRRLNDRGMFREMSFVKDAVRELELENNPAQAFLEEMVTVSFGDNNYITKEDLFNKYKEWCQINKQYNLSNARFSAVVYKIFHKETPKDTRLSNNGPRIWRNIVYKINNNNKGWEDGNDTEIQEKHIEVDKREERKSAQINS